jgi:predicted PurR-regulated permease PerM
MLSETKPKPLEPADRTLLELANEAAAEPPFPELSSRALAILMTPVQAILLFLGITAFLYFARPVVLPLCLACMAAMALKPLMRGLAHLHIPTAPSAAIVLALLVALLSVGFFQLGRPAVRWVDDAQPHLAELKARAQKLFPNAQRMGNAVAAVNALSVDNVQKKDGAAKVPTVEVKDQRGSSSILNWTGTFLAGLCEVLVLIYLLLASGDLFMHKLVRIMPTLSDKKRAIDISHEIQLNISNYLFTVSLINLCLGSIAAAGFYFLGVPKAAMWGMLVAILNFVPYFGPIVGVILLGIVGLLSFDSLGQGLLPAAWFLLLHLLEANFVTPILLGRRFTLNPVAIFVALMFWLWLWGIPGALLAVPILVSVKAVCDRFPKASYISELIGR